MNPLQKRFALLLALVICTSSCSVLFSQLSYQQESGMAFLITTSNLNQLYSQWQTFIYEADDEQELNFICHVNEGRFCYALQHDEVDDYDFSYHPEIESETRGIDRDFAAELIRDLGGRSLESAQNNTVLVRCHRSVNNTADVTCEVNGGSGWQSLSIVAR